MTPTNAPTILVGAARGNHPFTPFHCRGGSPHGDRDFVFEAIKQDPRLENWDHLTGNFWLPEAIFQRPAERWKTLTKDEEFMTNCVHGLTCWTRCRVRLAQCR